LLHALLRIPSPEEQREPNSSCGKNYQPPIKSIFDEPIQYFLNRTLVVAMRDWNIEDLA
jgi:hypothetical protein